MPPANVYQSCKACRRLKRKCSRDTPACSLCVQHQRLCEYETGALEAAESYNYAKLGYLEWQAPNAASHVVPEFPHSYFLDSESFSPIESKSLRSRLSPDVLKSASELLSNCNLMDIVEVYLKTTHSWLPMLSRKRLMKDFESLNAESIDVDSLLLILSMKTVIEGHTGSLIVTPPPVSSLYLFTKDFLAGVLYCDFVSIPMVQALVLLGVYELGHGIYPAAYLTIGQAVRLGTMIGLHSEKHSQQLFNGPDTWTSCEERRRTWWAILMLDSVVVLGSERLLMSAPDPRPDSLLPSNDNEWNKGMVCINEALFTEQFRPSTTLGQFAKLCQGVHILRKVIRHVQEQKSAATLDSSVQEALQLHRTLEALQNSVQPRSSQSEQIFMGGDESSSSASAVCASARLFLYNQYACNEPTGTLNMPRLALEAEVQQLSLAGIKTLASRTVPGLAQQILAARGRPAHEQAISPVSAHCLYHAATECQWFIKEDDDHEMISGLQYITEALAFMSGTWRVCDKYLSLLEKKQDES